MVKFFIPPGGFFGFAQQTVAVKALIQRPKARRKPAGRRTARTRIGGPVKRRKRATVTRKKRRVVRSRAAKPARMVKGSPAAKRHMAKLRRMRKK